MFRKHTLLAGLLLIPLFGIGCSPGAKNEADIKVQASNDPLEAPRAMLKRYAGGQPLGSEATSFPKMVEDVRKVDQARADILAKGLEAIQKAQPASRPAIAKEVLAKLQPSMK